MLAKSNYLENEILDHILRNSAYTPAATVYLAAYTVAPTDADSGTEVTGGSYARQAITFNAAASGLVDNSGVITFPTATANWGEVVAYGIRDALTVGNLLYWGWASTLTYVFTAGTDDVLTIPGYAPTNGDRVVVQAIGDSALPTGISADTVYYIVQASGATCKLSLTQGGSAIDLTAVGAGIVIPLNYARTIQNGDTLSIASGLLDVIEN